MRSIRLCLYFRSIRSERKMLTATRREYMKCLLLLLLFILLIEALNYRENKME